MTEQQVKPGQSEARGPDYKDPPLLPSQVRLKELTDEMLKFKPSEMLSFARFPIEGVDPLAYLEKLKASSLGDLLLETGSSLSSEGDEDLELYAKDADLRSIWIRAWGWEYDKARFDPDGPTKPPYKIIEFPGEKDWGREIEILFTYGSIENSASVSLASQSYSQEPGLIPSYSRSVIATAYAETGYEGHNHAYRRMANDAEANLFYDIASELFEVWKTQNPEEVSSVTGQQAQ